MQFYENHRLQTIFVLLQVGVIMAGSLTTGAMMKVMGYQEGIRVDVLLLLLFVRDWGFLLILIPLAWTFLTITLEQRAYWYSKRWTIGSGLLVLAGLAWLLVYAFGGSTSCTLSMSEL